jgi:hypothetical protein
MASWGDALKGLRAEREMKPQDRDYFMMRAGQELDAASQSTGQVRGRHEELAWLYQMRVIYIDRGLFEDVAESEPAPEPIQHIIVAA